MRPTYTAVTALVLGIALSSPTPADQTPSGPITEAQAREWTTFAAQKANGDPAVFSREFTALVRISTPFYRKIGLGGGSFVFVHMADDLTISLIGVVGQFELSASEAVRKMDPIDKLPWPRGVLILVSPRQIDSPDIVRLVVRRAGSIIEPLVNGLVLDTLQTRMGATRRIHQGSLIYPASAFAPGAEVVVTAIPDVGSNIIRTFTEDELKGIV